MFESKTRWTLLSLSASLLLGIVAVAVLSNGKTIGTCAVKAIRTGTRWELKLLKDRLGPSATRKP